MKPKLLSFLAALPVVLWLVFGLRHTLGPDAFRDKIEGFAWLMCGCALALCYLAALFSRKMRRTAAVLLVSIVVLGGCVMSIRDHRLRSEVRRLEAIYHDIASCGQPFPEAIDMAACDGPKHLRWYYQKNSGTSFAIVYILYSDGLAMEYPDGEWRWIGYVPNEYNPDDITQVQTEPFGR